MDTGREVTNWPRRVLAVLAALNAIGALAGAWGLFTGVLDLGATVTGRLPGDSPEVAGIALALLVGVPNLVLLVVCLRRRPELGTVGVLVGAGMVGWILLQLAFIRDLTFFHPLYVGIGAVMIWAGLAASSAADESSRAVSAR
jgi:hypothetical protein